MERRHFNKGILMLLRDWKPVLVTQHNLYSCSVVYYYTKSCRIAWKGKILKGNPYVDLELEVRVGHSA